MQLHLFQKKMNAQPVYWNHMHPENGPTREEGQSTLPPLRDEESNLNLEQLHGIPSTEITQVHSVRGHRYTVKTTYFRRFRRHES